jgi:hypothetical protein
VVAIKELIGQYWKCSIFEKSFVVEESATKSTHRDY